MGKRQDWNSDKLERTQENVSVLGEMAELCVHWRVLPSKAWNGTQNSCVSISFLSTDIYEMHGKSVSSLSNAGPNRGLKPTIAIHYSASPDGRVCVVALKVPVLMSRVDVNIMPHVAISVF